MTTEASKTENIEIDFLDPDFRANPYPALTRLRELDPVHRAPNRIWIVTRHGDVDALNRDRRLGRDLSKWSQFSRFRRLSEDNILDGLLHRWMLNRDPPDHGRLRRLASPAFANSALAAMRPLLENFVDDLLNRLDGEVEFMTEFAQPVTIAATCLALGLPLGDHIKIQEWSDHLGLVLEPTLKRGEIAGAEHAAEEMLEYVRRVVGFARQHRSPGFLANLIEEPDRGRLTEEELLAMVVMLLATGATSSIIGMGMEALARRPEELERLHQDGSLLNTAVEELLRFSSPAVNLRIALEDVEVGGKRIPTGDVVFCMLGAANRDPEVFVDPDHLDLGRRPNPHLTFGGGIHQCLGAPLARMAAHVAFSRISARWLTVDVDEHRTRWCDRINPRTLEFLPLRVSPKPRDFR